MELAHQAVMKGEPDVAKQFLSEAWRLAVASDDADTRARVLLATGNAWYSEGAVENALQMWKQAKEEAEQAHSAVLTAAANIHLARGNLAEGSGQPEMSDTDRKKRAEESRATVLAAQKELDGTVVYEAYAWRVLSLAEKELGNTDAALQAIDRAADIHDGEKFLEDAGYDWYIRASILSKAERYTEALPALEEALRFDRRAEISAGTGRNWLAIGQVRNKTGDTEGARTAWIRARDIFRAAFLTVQAQEAEALLTQ